MRRVEDVAPYTQIYPAANKTTAKMHTKSYNFAKRCIFLQKPLAFCKKGEYNSVKFYISV